MAKEVAKEELWTVEDSENLYRVKLWGESYFYINEEGHLSVRPVLGDSIGIDVFRVVQDLKQQRIQFPLLIRFQDLLIRFHVVPRPRHAAGPPDFKPPNGSGVAKSEVRRELVCEY